MVAGNGDAMKSGASGYSVLAAPGDGRTPPRHSPAVTDPLHARGFIERDMPLPILVSLDQVRVLIASSKPRGASSSRFGHFTPKVGRQVTGDGWPGDAGGRASERLVTGRRFLEPAASGVWEG